MNPQLRFLRRLFISIQIRLSRKWRDMPFFIQSQMDIHPNSAWWSQEFSEKTGGFFPVGSAQGRNLHDHDCWDGVRRDMLILLMKMIEDSGVVGRFAELGVYKGGTARLMHAYAPDRMLDLFDTFSGFDKRDMNTDQAKTGHDVDNHLFKDACLEEVKQYVGCTNGNVKFYKGFFPESMPSHLRHEPFAFVHLDADLYAPILAGLELFYPLLSPGGVLIVHDYNAWLGARQAVDEFCSLHLLVGIPMPDKSGSFVFLKPL